MFSAESVFRGAGVALVTLFPPGLGPDEFGTLPIQGIKESSLHPRRLLAELDILSGNVYTGVDSLLSTQDRWAVPVVSGC